MQVFFCEFCEILRIAFFKEHISWLLLLKGNLKLRLATCFQQHTFKQEQSVISTTCYSQNFKVASDLLLQNVLLVIFKTNYCQTFPSNYATFCKFYQLKYNYDHKWLFTRKFIEDIFSLANQGCVLWTNYVSVNY